MAAGDLQKEAAEHVRKGRFAKAISLYRTALSEAPDDPELRAQLANAYKCDKNFERAFHHFKRSAAVYAAMEEAPAALQMLREANAVAPGEPDILYRIAESERAMGLAADFEATLVHLIKAAAAKGDRRRVWALDELFALYPTDLSIAERRAEALAETGRLDEAIDAYKMISARLGPGNPEFVQVLRRGATASIERPDIGADVCLVLLAHGRPKEALSALLPFYERHPDDVSVLEALLATLGQLGATDKVLAARVALIKARALHSMRKETLRDIDEVLQLAPDQPEVLEVCAHAANAVGDVTKASTLWRHLAKIAGQQGLRLERDRAILSLLKANPDDEEALELGAEALGEAGRAEEAATLRQQLSRVRKAKRAQQVIASKRAQPVLPSSSRQQTPHRAPTAPEPAPPTPRPFSEPVLPKVAERLPTESEGQSRSTATGTMILDEDDVLEIHSEVADEPVDIDIANTADHNRVQTNPWATATGTLRASKVHTFDEATAEDVGALLERLETSSAEAVDDVSNTGSVQISVDEFGPPDGLGSDDITTVAPAEISAVGHSETDSQGQPIHRLPTAGGATELSPFSLADVDGPQGSLVDPFFSDNPVIEPGALPPDEVTSRMEALVAEEARLRAESVVAPVPGDGTPQPVLQSFNKPLVSDLLEEAELPPKR